MAQRSSIRRSAILSGALVAVLGVAVSGVAYKLRDTTPLSVSSNTKNITTQSGQASDSSVATATDLTGGNVTETTLPTLGANNSVPPLAALDTVTGSTLVGAIDSSTTTAVPVTTAPPLPVPGASPCAPLDGSGERISQFTSAPPQCLDPKASYSAVITTKQGEIRIVLNARDTPVAVNAFVFLARHKFYDGLTFHRIVPGFIVQGGDRR